MICNRIWKDILLAASAILDIGSDLLNKFRYMPSFSFLGPVDSEKKLLTHYGQLSTDDVQADHDINSAGLSAARSAFLFLTWLSSVMENYSGKVSMVSMDGLLWDYLEQVDTPNFGDFVKHGVKLPYLNNSFATKTFPNHYSLVTGLYEESHGIVENHMYDPLFDATFGHATHDPRLWNEGEPMWVTAKKQGLRTGAYFGSEVEIRTVRPDFWLPYKESTPFRQRVDTVIDWFKTGGVKLVNLYFHEPDATGHMYGPDSQEVKNKVKEMDDLLGYIVQKMKENHLDKDINVIITSDHGMTAIDHASRIVDISDHVDMSKVARVPSRGPLLHLLPVEGEEDNIIQALTGVPHITVYRKENIPDFFHYKNNRRIMPIVIVADDEWIVTPDKTTDTKTYEKGDHGYDNRLKKMKPIFLANGPDFKKNYIGSVIKNVDIYPLVCELLGVNPAPNNGSLTCVQTFIDVHNNLVG